MKQEATIELEREFNLEEWLLEFEFEEDKADMHYSTYFTPENEEEELQ